MTGKGGVDTHDLLNMPPQMEDRKTKQYNIGHNGRNSMEAYFMMNLNQTSNNASNQTLINLQDARMALREQASTFLCDNRDPRTGLLSMEAAEEYKSMEARIMTLGDEIRRLEDQHELDRKINGETAGSAEAPVMDDLHGVGSKASAQASKSYSKAFSDMIRGQGNSVRVKNVLSVGVDSEGGYTVSDEFDKKLVQGLNDNNVIRRMAKVVRTESGDHKIPILAGGAAAGWVDENNPIPVTDMAFSRVTFGAYKIGALMKATNEFLHDTALDIEDYIVDTFTRAMAAKEELAFINGTGDNQPTGLLHDTEGAGIGATTENTGDVSFDDVIRLYYSLGAPYRKNAVFLCNDDVMMKLMLLKDGNGHYIWQPSLEVGKPDTIFGRPVYTTTAMPELRAGNKVLLFGDFDYFWIADRGHRTLRRLDERFAADDSVGFIMTQRLDSKLILKDAMKVLLVKE